MDMNWHNLFRYDAWANDLTLSSIRDQGDAGDEARKLYAHILAAQLIWYGRLIDEPATVGVWSSMGFPEMESQNKALPARWSRFLNENEGRLHEPCCYRNTEGKEFETAVDEILMHIIVHSGYHRGQIAAALRKVNLVPAATDFIAFTRR